MRHTYSNIKYEPNFWLNHIDDDGGFTNSSDYGNRAKVEIISQMRALAQPQVGSVKRWMDDPQGFGGAPTGNANSMVMAGTAAIDAGADSFTNLTTNISEFQKLHRDAAPGSPEKESYRIQMMDAITTFQAATLEASKSGNFSNKSPCVGNSVYES